MKRLARLSVLVPIAMSPAFAGDNESLAGLRMECDTCHGVDGVSVVPDQTPTIAGKSEAYLFRQLQAFETGKRRHETMLMMGQKLSDQEMKALARYYSRVKR
ncbi:c-type cytochrome [Methylocystis echinoides]|uniref:c-type cytochrome n=1 Tax=Methylocystis echinoides TaxID=29468 RepID=UPI00341E3570